MKLAYSIQSFDRRTKTNSIINLNLPKNEEISQMSDKDKADLKQQLTEAIALKAYFKKAEPKEVVSKTKQFLEKLAVKFEFKGATEEITFESGDFCLQIFKNARPSVTDYSALDTL